MQRIAASAVRASRTPATRRMFSADAHHATPEYEGIEKVIRTYLPHNHQIVVAVLGFYGVIIGGAVLNSRRKAANAPKPVPTVPDYHTVKVVSAIPGVEDDGFEEFMEESDENVEKWFDSLETME